MNLSASEFNERYPVGVAVSYWSGSAGLPGLGPRATKTKSKAWETGFGPVVKVDGVGAGVSLRHLDLRPCAACITAARQEECIRCPYCEHVQDLEELPEYDLLVTLWGDNNGPAVTEVCCEECEEKFLVRENVVRTFDVAKTVEDFE